MTGERVDLDAIEARASAATEGPWLVEEADDVWELYAQRDRTHHGYKLAKCMKSGQPYAEYWPNERDAAFISHARQDIPALIAEVRSLRAQVAALAGERADETSVFGKYGNCPVQIERTIGDRQFYFRARGEKWSLCVGDADDMSEFAAVNGEEILSGVIHVPFIAGWMPAKLAEALTDWGIESWTRQQSGEFERNTKELLDALDAARGGEG
jgi:hypothetical protein